MSGVDIGPIPSRELRAHEVYAQAALLATDDKLAAWCRTMAQLTARLGAPHPLPVHELLARTEHLRSEGMAMQRSMWLLLCQAPGAELTGVLGQPTYKLSIDHALAWARIALQLQVQGVTRLAVQFSIELEAILAELAGVAQPRVSL